VGEWKYKKDAQGFVRMEKSSLAAAEQDVKLRPRERYGSTGMVRGQGDPTRQRHGQCLNCGERFYPCTADRARWYARRAVYFCKRSCAADWAIKEADRQALTSPEGA
jgi:hypothetical protein